MLETLVMSLSLTTLCDAEAQTLREAADRIEVAYVLEEPAVEVAEKLRTLAEQAPKASKCREKPDFASMLTEDLRGMSGDGHFYIEPTGEAQSDDWISAWRASGYQTGQGIERVEVLKGNIGYIRIRSFFDLEPAFPHYRAAFDMVADTDALILDLRANGGGSTQTTWPIQWTFLAPGSASPLKLESRVESLKPREEPAVLWRRYGTRRPVAIVIDARTFSAPEAVAFTLQQAGRATIIGEPSGGGAHMLDAGKALASGFTLYTPSTRPVSIATRDNWEGVGVTPDIRIGTEQSIQTAAAFLRKELENAAGDE